MSLKDLLANSAATMRANTEVETVPRRAPGTGGYTLQAEFFTMNRTIRGELTTSESRLSDHLNASTSSLEIRPQYAASGSDGARVQLDGMIGHVMKDQLLFAAPISEPERTPDTETAWRPTVERKCWVGVGPYRISGTMHGDPGYDARTALRLLDKQFVPITEASVTRPDGHVDYYPAVFVNRELMDMLTLKPSW